MKRFEFRLARLARVRHVQEEVARSEWLAAEQSAQQCERQVLRADEEIEAALAHMRAVQSRSAIHPLEILEVQESIRMMESLRKRLKLQAETARKSAERARVPWQELRAELEGLRRLEEKERSSHRRECEHADAVLSDQATSDRRYRQNNHPTDNH